MQSRQLHHALGHDPDFEGNLTQSTPVADLAARLHSSKTQENMVKLLHKEVRPPVTKALSSEVKAHILILAEHLTRGQPSEAIATALAMVFLDPDHAISCMRREGVLRASRYGYNGSLISRVSKAVLSVRELLATSPDRIAYLESVVALSHVAGNALTLKRQIEATIRAQRSTVLKTVFVMINSMFYNNWQNDPEASSLDNRRYSSEEYAEAASFVLHTYASIFPINEYSFLDVEITADANKALVYRRLLIDSIRLTKFREAELFIDGLPYRADFVGKAATVSSIDPDVERAVRLGYIQQQIQTMIRHISLLKAESVPSIQTVIDEGFHNGSFDQIIELKSKPAPRFILRLPVTADIFDNIFRRDEMFQEEFLMMIALDVENYGEFDELIFTVSNTITSRDILKAQRYFYFISCVFQRRLASIENPAEREALTLSSTLLVIPHASMIEQMRLVLGDDEKGREIIRIMTMDTKDSRLDIQYRPLVDIGEYYVVAPHVVAASNLVRNTIVANRLRSAAIGPGDRMVHSVTMALRSAGFEVESDVKARICGEQLELDIVARRDGSLFLFECKNAYHPVSVHEMRNSWDHIRSARRQLDKRREIFVDPVNQSRLFRRFGWEVGSPCAIHTGIVIANRVFHGANLNGHPIRQAHELINVLKSGRIVMNNQSLSFWLGEEFQTADLIAYLGPNSIASDQISALESRQWRYSMGHRDLVFSSYVLDMIKGVGELQDRHGPPMGEDSRRSHVADSAAD